MYFYLLLFNCQGSISRSLFARAWLLYHNLFGLSIGFLKFFKNFFNLFQTFRSSYRRRFGGNSIIISHLFRFVNRFLKISSKFFRLASTWSLPLFATASLFYHFLLGLSIGFFDFFHLCTKQHKKSALQIPNSYFQRLYSYLCNHSLSVLSFILYIELFYVLYPQKRPSFLVQNDR